MPGPVMVRDPVPPIAPENVRLWPLPAPIVFAPVSDKALPIESVKTLPLAVPVETIVLVDNASEEPLSVKVPLLAPTPLLVNDIVPSVMVPMLFVLVV